MADGRAGDGVTVQTSFSFDEPPEPEPPEWSVGRARVTRCAPSEALTALGDEIARVKGDDRLAPVSVVVATNIAGVMARRALGRDRGLLGVDVVTLGRIAELLAGPSLAADRRQPVSNPVLDVTIADLLVDSPGMFEPVADHPTTVTALREVHQELRLTGALGADALAARGRRGAEAVRLSRSITARLHRQWYDEADVLARATEVLESGAPPGVRHLVFHLPQRLDAVSARFAARLAALVPTSVIAAATGDSGADLGIARAVEQIAGTGLPAAPTITPQPVKVISTTDADDEVRIAVRTAVDAASGTLTGSPVAFERIGIFWPTHVPYARLVEHHLGTDSVPWNGRGGIAVTERIAPRLLLDLLDVDRRRFRRSDLFDLLADVPPRDADGRRRPTAEWHRVARAMGVSDGADWRRLATVDENSRWAGPAHELAGFVDELRDQLGRPDDTRTWKDWTQWCDAQLTRWLGPRAEIRLSDAEYRAWEALMTTLDRLRSLDHVTDPPTRTRFRTVLAGELDDVSVREGRIGTGIVTGSLASSAGLDLDVAIVLGGTDGVLPPPPASDPLLSDEDRLAAGFVAADERARQLHHAFRSLLDSTATLVTVPRGDLRSSTQHQMSRWLALPDGAVDDVSSAMAGLLDLARPPGERERRLRDRLRLGVPADPVAAGSLGDPILQRAIAMRAGRNAETFTEYDGDLSDADVPPLGTRPISPTQIQTWASCPHAYFSRYLLGVRPVEEPDREISIRALDAGSLQHEVLDRLHRDVLAGRLPQPTGGWTDEHRVALLGHFDEVADETERRGRTGRPATWFGERARLRSEVLGWLDRDSELARVHAIEILHSEFDFGRPPLDEHGGLADETWEPVQLRLTDERVLPVFGSADRVDLRADGTIVVTDHKTGRDSYQQLGAADPTLAGTVFQLPAYAAAALAVGGADRPVRAEYSMFGKGAYARRGFTFTPEVWDRVSADLTEIVDGIQAGWFPLRPERPGWRLFVACEHCDPDHIGTDDAWARWNVKRHDPRAERWFGDPPGADAGDDA